MKVIKKKAYHHGDLVNDLIKNGIEMINENGIENLSFRKLATKCGVSATAIYSHYSSKEEFLESLWIHVQEKFTECLKSLVEGKEKTTDLLVKLGVAYVKFFIENPAYFEFLRKIEKQPINLNDIKDINNFPAFEIFKYTSVNVLAGFKMPEDRIQQSIIAMWAMVQGIVFMAISKGVQYDGDWLETTERILDNNLWIR